MMWDEWGIAWVSKYIFPENLSLEINIPIQKAFG